MIYDPRLDFYKDEAEARMPGLEWFPYDGLETAEDVAHQALFDPASPDESLDEQRFATVGPCRRRNWCRAFLARRRSCRRSAR